MIIETEDINELERYLEAFRHFEIEEGGYPDEGSVEFFGSRPHLILPLGFDQSRTIVDPSDNDESFWEDYDKEDISEAQYRTYLSSQLEKRYGIPDIDFSFDTEWLYRQSSSGTWYWFEGLDRGNLLFRGPTADPKVNFSVEDLHGTLSRVAAHPDSISRTLWLPSIWTPGMQEKSRQVLSDNVTTLLKEIYKEKKPLREIRPRTLEEFIAELLRDQGMDVYVTKQTRDGGRDVIARGEFIPGEPMILAVEVKQKPVVGIEDLYKSLKANEDYPALLLATSGRFSAGVVNEKNRKRNELRLYLKDGVALSQWIAKYGAKRKHY